MTIVISSGVLLTIGVVLVAWALPELVVWLLGVAACALLVFIAYGFGVPVWISVPVVLGMLVLAGIINLRRPGKSKTPEPSLGVHPLTDRDRSRDAYPRHFAGQERLNDFL